ncbi:2OG-Fe(II) oxygenase [Nocardia bovistercoris]|uniref:2OG-Fe(II) oxygenase n=1 Tax=Nocardia bovistercoris TaxID=2785916 RepID=A0A931N5D8_9NOCA|nr:2OG-Fe(II) oxygenase [Nocardia bovistercoris]MBH0778568.1 2OG-Fe(II) oxygenase [Nocardia bovistercoris]
MAGESGDPPVWPGWFTELFAHRRWVRRTRPFPHVYARDVFTADFYGRLVAEYARVHAEEYGHEHGGIPLADLRDGPLALFTTAEWRALVTGVTGVTEAGDIEGSVREHPAGARWERPSHGLPSAGAEFGSGTVRAMFYLNNPDWRPGGGGETALYADIAGDAPEPAVLVPPLDNSILVFECAPRTWHTVAGGNAAAHHHVRMSLHRPPRRGNRLDRA